MLSFTLVGTYQCVVLLLQSMSFHGTLSERHSSMDHRASTNARPQRAGEIIAYSVAMGVVGIVGSVSRPSKLELEGCVQMLCEGCRESKKRVLRSLSRHWASPLRRAEKRPAVETRMPVPCGVSLTTYLAYPIFGISNKRKERGSQEGALYWKSASTSTRRAARQSQRS